MIKCDWYWKLLKLSFFGLLTSFFTIFVGSSVSADNYYKYQQIWLDSYPSSMNNQYDLTFLKWGAVKSEFLAVGRPLFALDENVLFWRTPNWYPYAYSPKFQWFFDRFYSCDYFDTSGAVANCSSVSIDYSGDNSMNYQILQNFFKKVVPWDYAYYMYNEHQYIGATYDYYVYNIRICFSSSELNKSLCFMWGRCSNDHFNDCKWYMTLSQNYTDLKFWNVPYWSISYAPWQAWYLGGWNIEGWNELVESAPITWDVMLKTCTKSRALDWYRRNWYNENMCYSSYWNNTDIFSGVWSVHDFSYTWTYIRSVWQDTSTYRREGQLWSSMDYLTWFKYWRNTYEIYQSRSDSLNNPFYGVPVSVFMLFGNITQYWRPYESDSILDYCTLLTYSDLNTPYSWFYSSQICSQSALDMVADMYWVHASGWQLVAWSSWVWITNRVPISWEVLFSWWEMQDSLSFQNNIFNLLKSVFRYPEENWNRFLPEFIVIWFIWIVFFRLIRKRY